MGSLTSRPSLPQVQQQPVILTVPAPVSTSPSSGGGSAAAAQAASTSASEASAAPEAQQPDPQAVAKAREDSLLSRARGRISTVLTGLNGVLTQNASGTARKTLLGE